MLPGDDGGAAGLAVGRRSLLRPGGALSGIEKLHSRRRQTGRVLPPRAPVPRMTEYGGLDPALLYAQTYLLLGDARSEVL